MLKKKKKSFYNQATLSLFVPSKKEKPVNLKLFSNLDGASLQMTGCKTVENIVDTLEKMFDETKKVKGVIDTKTLKIIDKPFCKNIENLNYNSIKDIVVAMIVSKFTYPCIINRPLLFELLPNIPTIAEAGVPGYDMSTWYGLVGPANMPTAVLKILSNAVTQTVNEPEFKERLIAQGQDPKGSSPEEFGAFIKAESVRWAAILKEMKVKVE